MLDPAVEPDDLRAAIERNWWPALVDDRFTVVIRDADEELYCRPKSNPQLQAFIEAYELIKSGAAGDERRTVVRNLGPYQPAGGNNVQLGQLALVADPDGWSFPDEASGDDESRAQSLSLVALTRDPRMVVEYHLPGRDISRRVPHVRGVFVATHDVNTPLAKTEPKAHDKWDSRESVDVPLIATKYAREISSRIRTEVKRFQDELRPPVDESGAVRLRRLDEKLAKLKSQQGKNPPPPLPAERPFSFGLGVRREQRDEGLVVIGHVDVRKADGLDGTDVPSVIRIALAIDEDGKRGVEIPLHIVPPSGFTQLDGESGRFAGDVTSAAARFTVESDPYRVDWTGQLLVTGEIVASSGGAL